MTRFLAILCLLIVGLPVLADPLFMSKEQQNRFMGYWPATNDKTLLELKNKISIYTEKQVPLAFQFFGGVHGRVFAAFPDGKPSDANHEFPWGFPAGLHKAKNWKVLRFVHFAGPITYYRTQADNKITIVGNGGQSLRYEPVYVWEYTNGTVFGELLTVQHKDGSNYTFEVRTRTRNDRGDWSPKVYRPFPTREDLDEALAKHGWAMDLDDAKRVRLVSDHRVVAFRRAEEVSKLPTMDEKLVKKLLQEPFKEVKERFEVNVIAPTTDADFGIYPKEYMGGMVRVSKNSCMGCHEHTLVHARDFDIKREWYGRVRGSDNILSFHIFEPSSISYNGINQQIQFRKDLVKAGLLKPAR